MIKLVLEHLCGGDFVKLRQFLDIFGDDLAAFKPIYEAFGKNMKAVSVFLLAGCRGDFGLLFRIAKGAGPQELPRMLVAANGSAKALKAAVEDHPSLAHRLGGSDVEPQFVNHHRVEALKRYADEQAKLPPLDPPKEKVSRPRPDRKTGIHTLDDLRKDDGHDDGHDGGGGGPSGGGSRRGNTMENQGNGTVTLTETSDPPQEPKSVVLHLQAQPENSGKSEKDDSSVSNGSKGKSGPPRGISQDDVQALQGLFTRLMKLLLTALQGLPAEEIAWDQRDSLRDEALMDAPNDHTALQIVNAQIARILQLILDSTHDREELAQVLSAVEDFLHAVGQSGALPGTAEAISDRIRRPRLHEVEEDDDPIDVLSEDSNQNDEIVDLREEDDLDHALEPVDGKDGKVEDAPKEDTITEPPPPSKEELGLARGRAQLKQEVKAWVPKVTQVQKAAKEDKRVEGLRKTLNEQLTALKQLTLTLGTADAKTMKAIRRLMREIDETVWRIERDLAELAENDRLSLQMAEEELQRRASYGKKTYDSDNNNNGGDDDKAKSIKVTWSWGSTIGGQLGKLRDDGIWPQMQDILNVIDQPQYVSVSGAFADHAGLQKFHSVGAGLYESYLDTETLGSGSELRCFYRVRWIRQKNGTLWVHFTIIAIGDHVLKNQKVRKEDFGRRDDDDNPPEGFVA